MIARYLLAALAIVALSIAAIIQCTPVRAEEPADVDVAIVFLVDTSLSMDARELRIARAAHVEAFRSPEVLSAIEDGGITVGVAYAEFGMYGTPIVSWTVVTSAATAEAFAAALEAAPVNSIPQTSIGAGLAEAARMIDTMPFAAARIVVDVVGDGVNSTSPDVPTARNALLERGAVINGMPLMLAPSDVGLDLYYETTVIGGPGAFSMPLTRIEQMPAALRQKIIAELF